MRMLTFYYFIVLGILLLFFMTSLPRRLCSLERSKVAHLVTNLAFYDWD